MTAPDPTKRPYVGVSVLVHRQDKFLLAKRGKAPAQGLWSLPGGHVEFGEALDVAARRELQEETQLTPENPFVFGEYVEIIREGHHYVIMVFFVEDNSNVTAVAGDDAADIGWFTSEELDELDRMKQMTPTTRDRIGRLSQRFDNGDTHF